MATASNSRIGHRTVHGQSPQERFRDRVPPSSIHVYNNKDSTKMKLATCTYYCFKMLLTGSSTLVSQLFSDSQKSLD